MIKKTARIPVVPADISAPIEHKDKELLMDLINSDLYIKDGDSFINITGAIRSQVQEIQDGSAVIHLCTEENLPAVKDRKTNHWYYVITDAKSTTGGIDITSYIYYGVINDKYYADKSYLLIAQNMITTSDIVFLDVLEGYSAAFYVPVDLSAKFKNADTGEVIPFSVVDRLYIITPDGTAKAYDVYTSNAQGLGKITIDVDFEASNFFVVSFSSNHLDITGLELPSNIQVTDGNVIGYVKDPVWFDPRYVFLGWSRSEIIFDRIDLSTYAPTSNLKVYAYFQYDDDPNKYTYKSIYRSSTGVIIGEFYSVALPNTEIFPKPFIGYDIKSQSITLINNGQTLTFNYDPIAYNIVYDMVGGSFEPATVVKDTYTIEDEYAPPTPIRDGYVFDRWTPRLIEKGSTGDMTFTAVWNLNAIISSDTFRANILGLDSNILTDLVSITRSENPPSITQSYVNTSNNLSECLIWYDTVSKTLFYYTANGLATETDINGMFKDFESLRDISSLAEWIVPENADIQEMFMNCTMLSDTTALNGWNITSYLFNNTFVGTSAYMSNRLPTWYKWDVTIIYRSTSINESIIFVEGLKLVPNSEYTTTYYSPFYNIDNRTININFNNIEEIIDCTPISYNITYNLNEGTISGEKTTYTIEDSSVDIYTPPTPIKEGFVFSRWVPENIPLDNTGNVLFTATWE